MARRAPQTLEAVRELVASEDSGAVASEELGTVASGDSEGRFFIEGAPTASVAWGSVGDDRRLLSSGEISFRVAVAIAVSTPNVGSLAPARVLFSLHFLVVIVKDVY